MKHYIATIASYRMQSETLTEANFNNRLLSYYLLKDYPDHIFTHYIETGLSYHNPKKRRLAWNKNRTTYLKERRISLAERLKNYEAIGDDKG